MWSSYEPPREPISEPERDVPGTPSRWPVLGRTERQPRRRATSPGSAARSGSGAGVGALVGGGIALVAVLVGTAAATQEAEPSYSGWYDCIASYQDEEPGLLTPADFCEIGHERPPGYTDYDDYDWSPGQDYESWSDHGDGTRPDYYP